MQRRSALSLVALVACAILLAACARTVKVESGERVVDSNGRVVSSSIKVLEVPADQADKYSVVTRTVPADSSRLEQLYLSAQAAIASGDTTKAVAALKEIVKIDPTYKKAPAQLADIQAGRKPAADTTGTTKPSSPTTPPSKETSTGKIPVGPVTNLSGWVPETLMGFRGEPVTADVFTLSREYGTTSSNVIDALVVVVEQYKDASAAKKAVSAVVTDAYPASPSTFTVKGRSVRFGTDGHRFAVAVWNENGVVVAIEVSSKARKPADVKSTLESLVTALIR